MKHLNRYTIREKLKYLTIVVDKGKHYVEDNFGIARKSLRDWESQKNELEKAKNKYAKFRIKGNKSSITFEKEEKLIAWINFNRKLGKSITTSIIIIKICELVPEIKLRSISCLYQWCYRFLRRSGYSIRIPSHIGQPYHQT